MARESSGRAKRATESKNEGKYLSDNAPGVRKQLLWTVAILGLAGAIAAGLWWGREIGWGDPAKAVARKMAKGEAAFVAGDLAGAAEYYAAVSKNYPQDPQAVQALTQQATVFQQLGRAGDALGVLMQLEQRLSSQGDKSDLRAYTLLEIAKVKKSLADMEGALQAYGRVRNEHPMTDWAGEAQSGIGGVMQAQRRFPDARAAYGVLIKELPGGFLAAEAQTAIGECYEAEGNLKAAQRAYQMVLDRYPSAVWDTAKARLDALKKDLETKKSKTSS